MLSPRVRFRLFSLISRHGIRVLHSEPGRIVVSIATWREFEREILQLIEELQHDPYIYEIQFSNGVAEVVYDEAGLTDPAAIDRWLNMLNKYPF